ncbi:unnamed protein product [Cylicostephanus goldi]|uniref:Uncharacterized protein n=1 Tax=Cylicostephanus goldi TaxID=71465 RepID=A0A3P6QKR9_CYLGO|nr:unnamed protein product [Cylicostephanus goldi]
MRRRVKRWRSVPPRHQNKVADAAVLYKALLKVKLDQDPPRIEDFDPFPPTCSSSEDHDRISPPNEAPFRVQEPPSDEFVRFRGNSLGSSTRDYSPHRETQLNHISYNGPEKTPDIHILSALPPRAPIRNSVATASLRSRPPPPPYTATGRQKPPPYPGRNGANSVSRIFNSQLAPDV